MIKALVEPLAYVSGKIPITLCLNTNTKYLLKKDTIDVMASGITEIKANITFISKVSGEVTLTAYADELAIDGASASVNVSEGEIHTLNINDVIMTDYLPTSGSVGITFELSKECTLVSGDVICEFVCV